MIRILFAAPLLFLLVLFALSNPQMVQLGIWPTDFAIEAPLSIAILVAMAIAFLIGAVMLWAAAISARAMPSASSTSTPPSSAAA